MMGLSHKQQRFVELYVGEANGNATEAARLAGYRGSDNTLRSVGSENLTKPAIREAIREATEWLRQRARWTREDKLKWPEGVMAGEVMDTYGHKEKGWVDGPPSLKVQMDALKEHNKMCGDYPDDKVEHTHKVVRVSDETPTHVIEARVLELKNGEG